MKQYLPFSVVISVYENDSYEFFEQAMMSVMNQTVIPDEILLIVDGPVPSDLEQSIERMIDRFAIIKTIFLKKNSGLGYAMNIAVKESKNELVARMDSDDLAVPDRFEQQLRYFSDYPDLGIIGGDITEFIGSPENVICSRILPTTNEEIKKYLKKRCPFNHMTVMFRKSEVIKAGNYLSWYFNEDYYLWIRMMENGCQFGNTGTVLVNVRVGKKMYCRRGGIKYYMSEKAIQNYLLKKKMINLPIYFENIIKRLLIQVILPNKLRKYIYLNFARKSL